jgi:hypothetical protein
LDPEWNKTKERYGKVAHRSERATAELTEQENGAVALGSSDGYLRTRSSKVR